MYSKMGPDWTTVAIVMDGIADRPRMKACGLYHEVQILKCTCTTKALSVLGVLSGLSLLVQWKLPRFNIFQTGRAFARTFPDKHNDGLLPSLPYLKA